jgi:predicted nucleotidyltransferase component of viral defense system
MLNDAISTMLQRYRCQTISDYQNALKEIFQELALLALWRAKFFEHAAFYGGTALRLLYGLDRFSEDLDFSLLAPKSDFDLSTYHEAIRQELLSFGFESSVVAVSKTELSSIKSAFIKANTLKQLLVIQVPVLKLSGSRSASIHPEQTMKIKLEIDTNPPPGFQTNAKILLQPIPFAVNTYQLPDLFAGKLHAVLARGWKKRIKGRDWYDFAWYVGRETPVRISHLASRLRQSGHQAEDAILTPASLHELLLERTDKVDFNEAKNEVRPFLRDPTSIALWSKEFFVEVAGRLRVT